MAEMSQQSSSSAPDPLPLPLQVPLKVKICGTTSVKDARLSAEAGADALGFIFAPVSKRLVSPQVAREAGLAVGVGVVRVGVFMNQGLDEVLRIANAARVSAIQLHGPVSADMLATIRQYYPVLRVLQADELIRIPMSSAGLISNQADTLMVDAPQPGSGQPLDWAALRPSFPAGAWLAGGLGPENVAGAIRELRPAAVDAVSKLEAHPGIKDPGAVRAFVQAARAAQQGYSSPTLSYPQ